MLEPFFAWLLVAIVGAMSELSFRLWRTAVENDAGFWPCMGRLLLFAVFFSLTMTWAIGAIRAGTRTEK